MSPIDIEGNFVQFGGSLFGRGGGSKGGHGHIYLHSIAYRLHLAIVKGPCTRNIRASFQQYEAQAITMGTSHYAYPKLIFQ